MTTTQKKFVNFILSRKPLMILTVVCAILGIAGVLMSDHLRNRTPFTILFSIGFLLNLLLIIVRAIAGNMKYKDDLKQLRKRRSARGI